MRRPAPMTAPRLTLWYKRLVTERSSRRLLLLGAVMLLAILAALAFVGYGQPELLLDYVNLRYCG